MDITTLADARELLYGEPVDSFVAARDDLVKQIRAEGNRELANEVKALRKPSALAAEVNKIVRADPDGIGLILQAAALLRAAQDGALDGSAVDAFELQRQYRAAIQGLAQSAPNKQAEVRAAIEAATIDEDSNEALQSGCLVVVPTPVSIFGAVPTPPEAATAAAETPATDTAAVAVDELAERRARHQAKQAAKDTKATAERTHKAAVDEQSAVDAELQLQKEADEKAAAKAAAERQQAADKAAAELAAAAEEEERARREREKQRAEKRAALKKAHRDAVRAHLAALDDEQAATSSLEQVEQTLAEIDDERQSLEHAIAAVIERQQQATEDHAAARGAAAEAGERATDAEAAADALAAALDELTDE